MLISELIYGKTSARGVTSGYSWLSRTLKALSDPEMTEDTDVPMEDTSVQDTPLEMLIADENELNALTF
ncbi:MAG: hypothetical protein Q9162_002696 [Coniocarpon cinnabarinum]